MDQGVQKLLNQISDLESKNRLIHIQIEELKTTEKELQKNEKELILEIENICKQIKCMEKEEIELNNDISRVNLICKNVEATLHNEFVKVEIAAQKINQIEYYEEKDKNINTDLVKCDDKVKECLTEMNTADNNSFTMLKEMKDKNFLVSQVSIEDLCEIYEETKEKYQDNSFKNQCHKIAIVDYRTHSYFCNPAHLLHMTHLLTEKIRGSNNDPYFNLANIANYYGLNEEKKDTKIENFGLSELNKIMINHYKSKKINVNNGI
ncbi:conserved Plasmodium protein, unknown function [Plasmodium ovale]|uniref:Uncharacterized protein n=2 Tax=Plasmodium ovale TaxID=36330 RepID=A0A1A8W6T8_PLAOA|nr:conserved Plasmodium protein, unknown function [Plasmodium ovale curtisi]SCQ17040.1 conserved Plasmodium protein, unknown function [Plasmodium ovale]